METGTIIMMILTIGLIWGGFVYFLVRMMKQMKK